MKRATATRKLPSRQEMYRRGVASAAVLSALSMPAAAAGAGETRIVPDGRTETNVSTEGDVSDVTTGTTSGENAFNSFKHFRVAKGHKANLRLPEGTQRLINLVHDSKAVINGTVNSLIDGAIGGEVLFADPHGIVVGASGTLNVGSLGLATPSQSFMDKIVDPSGAIGADAVDRLIAGDFAVTPGGDVTIRGEVNADDTVRVLGGNVTHTGDIRIAETQSPDDTAAELFRNAVNVEGMARGVEIAKEDGDVVIAAAGDAEVDGAITADGSDGDGGNVLVTAGDSATAGGDTKIDVGGDGADADGGTVALWGDSHAELGGGASVDADAGASGDGGLVEVSAGETVEVGDAEVSAEGAGGGAAGTFLVDPDDLTLSGTLGAAGTNYKKIADGSITLEQDAIVDTSTTDGSDAGDITLKAPSIVLMGDGTDGAQLIATAENGGAGGDITLNADGLGGLLTRDAKIDVQRGTRVDATVEGAGDAGDIAIDASVIDDGKASGLSSVSADVDIAGKLDGGDVAVSARAKSSIKLSNLENPADLVSGNITEGELIDASFDSLTDLSNLSHELPAAYAVAKTVATVDIEQGSLRATGNVDVSAKATRTVDTTADDTAAGALGIAAMYGQVSGTTRAKVADGARVTAGGDVAVRASSHNSLTATAKATGGARKRKRRISAPGTAYQNAQKIGGALAIGHADTTTTAKLRGDVAFTGDSGRDVTVAARERNSFSSTASFTLASRPSDTGIGLTGAFGVFNARTDARLGSDLGSDSARVDDVRVNADSVTDGNQVRATTGVNPTRTKRTNAVKSSAGASQTAQAYGGSATGDVNQAAGGSKSSGQIKLGAAFAVGLSDLRSDARLDDGTVIDADGHFAVQARTKQTDVRSVARNTLATKGASDGSLASISTGITISRHTQRARALVGNDTVVTADTVGVRAESRLPRTVNLDDGWTPPSQWKTASDVVDAVKSAAGSAKVAAKPGRNLFTSFTETRAKSRGSSGGLQLAGSINYFEADQTTEAWIGSGADVTARGIDGDAESWTAPLAPGNDGTDWAYDAGIQIEALTVSEALTGAGVMTKLTGGAGGSGSGSSGSGSGSQSGGVGGVFSWVDLDADTSAGVADEAAVTADADGVAVNADSENLVVQVLPAAGKGPSIGVSGVFGLTTVNNDTRALVADSATLTATPIAIDADQSFQLYGLAGAVTLAQQTGVGLSAFVHNLETTTESAVGDIGDAGDEDGDDAPDNRLPDALRDGAVFADGGGTLTTGDLDIEAESSGDIASLGVAGAASRQSSNQKKGAASTQQSNQQSQSSEAQTQSENQVSGTKNGTNGNGNGGPPSPSSVLSQSSARMQQRSAGNTSQKALSGGGGGQKRNQPKFGLSLAGSAAFNRSDLDTTARLGGVTVHAPDDSSDTDVKVRALNDTDLIGAAGSGALTVGGRGGSRFNSAIAGAVSIQWLENDTTAEIVGATVTRAGPVDVQAATAGDQVALGLGLSASSGGQKNLAAAGSASLSLIRGSTTASIDSATVTGVQRDGDDTAPDATVVAYDRARALTGGGAFYAALGQNGGGFGAAVTVAAIENDTTARIGGSELDDFRDVGVLGLSSSQVLNGAFTGGTGGRAAVGGAFYGTYVGNALTATVDARDDRRADIDARGEVTLRAEGVSKYTDLDDDLTERRDRGGWLEGASGLADDDRLDQKVAHDNDADTGKESVFEGDISGEMVLGAAVSAQASGQGTAGGLAFGFALVDTDYEASIGRADVTTGGELQVDAANNAAVIGLATGAAGGQKASFTGSLAANVIQADVTARVGAARGDLDEDAYRAVVDARTVDVDAAADGEVYGFSGSLSGSTGSAAAGASIGFNQIGGDVAARLRAADVTATGRNADGESITVDVRRKSAVRALAVAGQATGGNTSVGGSLVVNNLTGTTEAEIDQGSDLVSKGVRLRARDGVDELSGIWSFSGQFGGASSNAVGGAFAVNTIARTQTAAVDDAMVNADGDVDVISRSDANVRTGAIGASAAGSVAASGSLTINTVTVDETARITGATVDADKVAVRGTSGRSIWSLAGSFAGSGSTGVGFAGAVNTIEGTRRARIANSTVKGTDSNRANAVTVATGARAGSEQEIVSAAVAGAASGSTSVGGALTVNTITTDQKARLVATTLSADALDVRADQGKSEIASLAGSAAAGGSTGVGAGVSTNVIKGRRLARIEGSDLDIADSVDVLSATTGDIKSAGAAAAFAGTAGIGGAVTTNVLDATVEAGIRATRARGRAQATTVSAADTATIHSLASQASGSSGPSLSASAAVNRIGNTVKAYIEKRHDKGDYRADDVHVEAASAPTIRTVASGFGASGQVGLAGGVATNIVTTQTRAEIRDGAEVIADDDVAVTAKDRAIARVFGLISAFGGRAALAGTGSFNLVQGTTEARIAGAQTEVSALGRDPDDDLDVVNGEIADDAPEPSEWKSPDDFNPVDDLGEKRETVNGLAVRASSIQQVGVIGTSASGTVPRLTGSASAAGTGNVNVVTGTTRAAIDRATVNPASNDTPSNTADISVGASGHVFNVGFVSAASGGGWGALAGALDANVVARTTEARIRGAAVNAGDGVDVDANATQAVASFAAGGSGGAFAASGAVSLGVTRGTTRATIDRGAEVEAGDGGVSVNADTRLNATTTGGAGSFGLGAAFGAAFGVAVSEATTRAVIAGPETAVATPGAVDVKASTTTGLTPVAASASAASSVGPALAGSGAFGIVRNTTEARIERAAIGGAGQRAGTVTVDAHDTVELDTVGGALGVSAGSAGIGASAGVVLVQSATRAEILGADIATDGNVAVDATREADLFLTAASAGVGGSAGLAGSLGVLVIGDGSVTSDSEEVESPDGQLDKDDGTLSEVGKTTDSGDKAGRSVVSYTDPLQTADDPDKLTSSDKDTLDVTLNQGSDDETTADAALSDGGRYDTAGAYRNRSADQTVAKIGKATYTDADGNERVAESTVDAEGTVTVTATNTTQSRNVVGAIGVGGKVGAGIGIGFSRVYGEVTAAIDGGQVRADGVLVEATAQEPGDNATGEEPGDNTAGEEPGDNTAAAAVDSFVGSAGGFGAVSVNLADARVSNTVEARIDGAQVNGHGGVDDGDDVTVMARDQEGASASAYGAAVAGGIGVAGVYAGAGRDGSVTAELAPANELSGFDDVTVEATSDSATVGRGWAASGGLLGAATGTVVVANDGVDPKAKIGNDSDLLIAGTATVKAVARPGARADTLGIALGGNLAVGVSTATAIAEPTVRAEIGEGAEIDAERLAVTAKRLTTGDDDVPGLIASGIDDQFDASLGCPSQSDVGACAYARGASGSLIGSVNATNANALSRGETVAEVRDVTLPNGDVSVLAQSNGGQFVEATSFTAALIAAGGNVAVADNSVLTRAEIDEGASMDAPDGTLKLRALSTNTATGRGIAGSGGVVSGAASVVTTADNASTKATLGGGTAGSPVRVDDLRLRARHNATYKADVTSVQASVIGASGAHAEHSVAPTVRAKVSDDSAIRAEDLDVAARSKITNPRAEGYDLTSGSGGVVDAAAVRAESVLQPDTKATIGDGSTLDVSSPNGRNEETGDLEVLARNDFDVDQRVRLDSGGAIAVARGVSVVDIASGARVDVGDADLDSVGDLNLVARTQMADGVDARANVKTYGGAGAAKGKSEIDAHTVNKVDVSGGAELKALKDVRLLAGRNVAEGIDLVGERSVFDLTARTDLWNKTAFPIETDPVANAYLNQTNTVTVGGGADVKSVGDIELAAAEGRRVLTGKGKGTDLYRKALEEAGEDIAKLFGEDAELSLDINGGDTADESENVVRVEGRLEAGVHSNETLIIDGSLDAATQTNGIDFSIDERNIATNLEARIDELQEQLANTEGDEVADAALEAEIRLLQRRLQELGGGEDSDGDPVPVKNLTAPFIVVEDVRAGPGAIDITGDALVGSGEMRASGDASVRIENQGPAYLDVNDVTIPAKGGGQVTFNRAPVSGADEINDLNPDDRKGADFVSIETAESSPDPSIDIRSTFDPDTFDPDSPDDVDNENPQLDLQPSINIVGNVRNLNGDVSVVNDSGNVNISGKLRAQEVNIESGGSVLVSFAEGFRHIGGDPRVNGFGGSTIAANEVIISGRYLNLNGIIQSGIPAWNVDLGSADRQEIAGFRARWARGATEDDRLILRERDNAAGRPKVFYDASEDRIEIASVEVAGGFMELTGKIMNTGGTPEALNFSTENVSGSVFGLGTLDSAYENDETVEIESFGVGSAETTLKYDGRDDRVFFDGAPVENYADVGGTGGTFLLANGRRLSLEVGDKPSQVGRNTKFDTSSSVTDAGYVEARAALRVVDGYGRIDIDNDTGTALRANALDAGNDIAGTLRINDTDALDGKGSVDTTVYERVGDDVRVYNEDDDGTRTLLRTNADSRSAEYTPESGLKFGWSEAKGTIKRRTTIETADVAIGIFPSGSDFEQKDRQTDSFSEFIGGSEYVTTDDVSSETIEVEDTGYKQISEENWWKCVRSTPGVCWEVRYFRRTVEEKGTKEVERNIVAADHPIDVQFIGRDDPGIFVDNANAALEIAGNVNAPTGTVELTGDQIEGVSDGATVRAQDVVLDAETGIEALDVTAGNALRATTDRGPVEITSREALPVDYVASDAGDVTIRALQGGGIESAAAGTNVRGDDVTLSAETGSVGASGAPIGIDSSATADGVVNVTAGQDVFMRENNGDLRVERIAALGGDLDVAVDDGAVIDLNTTATRDKRREAELVRVWNEMALLNEGESRAAIDRRIEQEVEAYERRQERAYERYWREVRNLRERDDGELVADDFDPDTFDYELPAEERRDLLDDGADDKAIAELEAKRERDLIRMHKDILDEPADAAAYNPKFDYEASDSEETRLSEGASWTRKQLTNTIAAGLVTGETETSDPDIEEENFLAGGSVTIDAERIGAQTIGDVVIDTSGDDVSLTDEQRIALATAEPYDIKGIQDGDGRLRVVQREDANVVAGDGITARAGSDIFIGGEQPLELREIDGGAVRIKNADDTTTARPDKVVVDGTRVILEAGKGKLGRPDAPIRMDAQDRVTARGGDGVFVTQTGDLALQRVVSGGDVRIDVGNGGSLTPKTEGGIDILAQQGAVSLDVDGQVAGRYRRLNVAADSARVASGGDVWLGAEQFNGAVLDLALDDSTVGGTLRVDSVTGLDILGAVETGSMRASADGAIAAVSDDAVLINKDGLMHLEAGTAIGAPASPLRVEPDRLRASAQDGGIQLTNTGGITFDERSSAADADGIAWFNIADGGKVTAADLVGDRLTVDVDTLSGPRLEAREGAMNLTVGGSTNIDKVLGGASVHIDAGSIEIGEAVADARFTASTAARRGLLGAQDFTEVTADGPIDLASEGIVTAKRLISLNARIDVDGKAATITDRGAADTALSVATTGFQDHRELEAGGAMTLDAGGPLEWAVASGGAGLDADADGKIAVGGPTDPDIEPGETTFAGTIDIAGGADIDLDDTVESTGADIGLRAGNALTAEDLRAAGAVTVTDTGRAAIEQGEAGATLIVRTDGAQDHRELRAGGLMTLDAGGTLEWAIAAGNAELDTDAGAEIAAGGSTDGEVAKGETTFAGTVDIAGGADVDLDDTVDSTGADIAISAGNALTAEYLVADQAIAVTDTGRAAIELGKAGTTFDVATRDAQDHRELHAGSAMTLDAGGPLEWAIATGNATLDADAAGDIAAGGFTDPNVGSGTTSFAGRGDIVGAADIDLNDRVESTGGDIALSAEDALSAEELIADQAITVFNTGSAAIELGEAGATFDVVTRGFQNHGTLTAGDAMGFEAGIDHDGFENDAAGGSDFAALELTSETGDIHVDAGSAAVEFATANADDRAIRVHTTGIQSHGQLLGYDGVLEADGEVQLTAGDTVRFRDIKAGKDTDVPANGGDARIVSLDGDILGNRIDASRDIILRALKGNLEIERLDYGGSYTLEAGRDIIAGIGGDFDTRDGEINAGRNIDIETLGTTDEPGDILVGGIETEDGFVQLDAARDVRIAVDRSGNEPTSGRLDAGTSVEIIAGRDVLVDRQMTAGKNIDIDASRDVALFTVDSGGDQTIDAGGGLTFGALDAGGAIAIDSGGSTVGLGAGRAEAVAAKGPVHMDAGVDIRLDAATVAGTDVDIDAVRDIALFIVGSGGDQTLDAGGDLAFDRVDAGGSVITRSAKATYGRSGDQADSVIADEQVDMVAGLADGTFDGESDLAVVEVAGQTVRLSAADVLDVDTVRADEAADLEGRAYDTYVTHTGPGSLDLDATGPANTLARMFALEVDARGGIDSERVYTVAGEIDTNADRAFIEDAWIDSQLDLRTASAYTLINNRATAARPADFQLHDQLDRRSMLEVDGKDLFTDAFVVRFGFGFQNEVPNFAGDREYTGIDMVGQSGARNGMRRRDIDRDALAPFRLIELTQRGAGQVVAVPESDAVVNQSFQNDETQDEQ